MRENTITVDACIFSIIQTLCHAIIKIPAKTGSNTATSLVFYIDRRWKQCGCNFSFHPEKFEEGRCVGKGLMPTWIWCRTGSPSLHATGLSSRPRSSIRSGYWRSLFSTTVWLQYCDDDYEMASIIAKKTQAGTSPSKANDVTSIFSQHMVVEGLTRTMHNFKLNGAAGDTLKKLDVMFPGMEKTC
jgi:hypothetical protein